MAATLAHPLGDILAVHQLELQAGTRPVALLMRGRLAMGSLIKLCSIKFQESLLVNLPANLMALQVLLMEPRPQHPPLMVLRLLQVLLTVPHLEMLSPLLTELPQRLQLLMEHQLHLAHPMVLHLVPVP